MASARLTLVTCSYRQARFLDATIRSVRAQACPELEHIVIDGASDDGSVDTIRRHAEALAHWVSEPDGGQTAALRKGLALGSGDLQGWLCSDDLLLPGAARTVIDFFDSHPDVEAMYGDALWIDEAGRYLRAKKEIGFHRFIWLFDHNYVPQPSMFWRRRLYERVGGLDEGFHLAMDSDLWERFSRQTAIVHLPAYLSCMRSYPAQKMIAQRAIADVEDARIRARSAWSASGWQPLLRTSARLARCALKLCAGGYWARPRRELLAALADYRIGAT